MLMISSMVPLYVQHTGAYVQLLIDSPFLHHLTALAGNRNNYGSDAGLKSMIAAMDLVDILQQLKSELIDNPIHPRLRRSLILAATALLVVEFGAQDLPCLEQVKKASIEAEVLLKELAKRCNSASSCYQSLAVRLFHFHAQFNKVLKANWYAQPLYQLKQQQRILADSPIGTPELSLTGINGGCSSPTDSFPDSADLLDNRSLFSNIERPREKLATYPFPDVHF